MSGTRFMELQDKIPRKPELDAIRVGSSVVLPFVNMTDDGSEIQPRATCQAFFSNGPMRVGGAVSGES